ncbi:hypothetical protein HDU99_005607, partial [Rhizoclosmatium hyalinum]
MEAGDRGQEVIMVVQTLLNIPMFINPPTSRFSLTIPINPIQQCIHSGLILGANMAAVRHECGMAVTMEAGVFGVEANNRSQPLIGGAPGPYPMMTPAPVVGSPPPMDSAQLLQYMQYHQEMATRAYQSYQQQQQKQQQLTSPKISASKTNVASSPLAGGEKSKRSSKASSLSSVGKKQSSMKLSTVHQGGSETESEDEGGMTSTQPLTHRTHSTPSLRSGPPPPSILRTTSVGVTTKKGVKFDAEASVEDGKGPMTKRRKEKK